MYNVRDRIQLFEYNAEPGGQWKRPRFSILILVLTKIIFLRNTYYEHYVIAHDFCDLTFSNEKLFDGCEPLNRLCINNM